MKFLIDNRWYMGRDYAAVEVLTASYGVTIRGARYAEVTVLGFSFIVEWKR